MKLVSDENKGFWSEEEIRLFDHNACNDYLNSHSKEELNRMSLKQKIELIIELEYNFQF